MAENKREETEDITSCKYNHGVICGAKNACEKCGWNPSVASDRKLRRIARDALNTKGEILE